MIDTKHINEIIIDSNEGVRLGTLTAIRWMAIAGQTICILIIHYVLGFSLPEIPILVIISASIIVNMWLTFWRPANKRLTERAASLQLAFDLLNLTLLLFVTGGLTNPFSVLMLAPTIVAASIMGKTSVFFLNFLSITAITTLAFTPFPLPWAGQFEPLNPLYKAGVWTGLSFTTIFLSIYIARVAREGRAHARALAATNIALEKEQKLAELGTLAAAAAHELGTPLGTIMLISSELMDTYEGDETVKAEIKMIADETARCRAILSELRETRNAGDTKHFEEVSLEALIREAAEPFEKRSIQMVYENTLKDPLVVSKSPEIIHALRNIIENATGYARSRVDIKISQNSKTVTVNIEDDGIGFDAQVIKSLGEPYVTTRTPVPGKDGGMGLGLFIAKTLLERTGARLKFDNKTPNGACVSIRWSRSMLALSETPKKR
ncbi:two-component sensor histidine kinase [Kordiimonas sediminis]|uniref:histidine kinase n=1 Tax=Kordiimonas sediminis TaxID=1735581 RepID=A0A919E5X5_9PROT|nr:ActS/PrrB/RegB family redox-sensitive histidine kinase [Kordiimonas sediminis]GHF16144.1 two-component sensor histidine kinase [Kordiimonas sediminis]